jgi:GWxTD domain-containing protein
VKLRTIAFLLLFPAITPGGEAAAQDPRDAEAWGAFDLTARVEADSSRVPRVYFRVAVPMRRLTFIKQGPAFVSRVRITAYLKDPHGRQVAGDVWEETVTARAYSETSGGGRRAVFDGSLPADPGRYRLAVRLDVLDTSNRYTGSVRVNVPNPGQDELFLGGLDFWELGENAVLPDGGGPLWIEAGTGEGEVRPCVSRSYDMETGPPRVTFDVYHYGDVSSFQVSYRLVTGRGRIVAYGRSVFPVSGSKSPVHLDIDYDRFSPARYRLDLAAGPVGGEVESRLEEPFRIRMNRRSWKEDYLRMIAQVEYIASEEEMRELREAPPGRRRKVWEAFWARRDPVPSTPENEAREEHFRRVRYANEHFGGTLEGWKSDRGRIYIINGPPDEIAERDRNPFSPSALLWYYYASRKVYTFVDSMGTGEYRLEHVGFF